MRLILCDIDGTLVNHHGGIDDNLIPALRKVMKSSRVGLISGRDASSCLGIYRVLDLNGLVVAEHGSHVLVEPEKDDYLGIINGYDAKRKAEIWKKVEKLACIDKAKLYMVTLYLEGHPLNVLSEYRALAEKVRMILPEEDVLATPSGVDILKRGVSKATGMKMVLDHFRIKPSEVMFLVDSWGDLDAAKWLSENGGKVGVVNSDDKELLDEMRKLNSIFAKKKHSAGAAELLEKLG
ncbi:MAG: Cof-type HAD-IIB family hydrolase [Nanoarchaeota archaeon]|nr:Cof-type HAD-IIB family hydrolase [Nanoarchaeota archaeon]